MQTNDEYSLDFAASEVERIQRANTYKICVRCFARKRSDLFSDELTNVCKDCLD